MESIKDWINDNNFGYGYGSGYGDGSGSGYGNGYGYGDGSGYGNGYGYGNGDGSGYGNGYGYGNGDGYGDSYGFGYGNGYGICMFEGKSVYMIDEVPTIIDHIKESFAMGHIVNDDFTLSPCFVAKGNGYFAHGETLREVRDALRAKIFENMDSNEAIEKFMEKFKKGEKYTGTEFFEWHHYLTGSCLMGRKSFVKNHGLDLDALYTVDEFIALCEDDYGGEIIRQLKERWEDE